MREFGKVLYMGTTMLLTIRFLSLFIALVALVLAVAADKRSVASSSIPPDLNHISHDGFGYTIDCGSIGFLRSGQPVDYRRVCRVTALVKYDDGREPWTRELAEISNANPDKALHAANSVGEKWMVQMRKAILAEAKK